MSEPTITRYNANVSFSVIDDIALIYCPGKSPSEAEVDAMRRHLIATAARAPRGFALAILIPDTAGPPEGKAREDVIAMFRGMSGRLKFVSGVLEGVGFGAAAKRAVFNLIVHHALKDGVVKVFSTTGAGCDFLAEKATAIGLKGGDSFALQACFDRMRSET
jgi:hypothetical protein